MIWELQLVGDYIVIDHLVQAYSTKQKNRTKQQYFTDSEVLTVWYWGLRKGLRHIKDIHSLAIEVLHQWFPKIPGYQQFDKRLNSMADLIELCFSVLSLAGQDKCTKAAIDSMPVVLAGSKRSSRASIASDIANKGYCASKDHYYYGVKLHLVVAAEKSHLPLKILVGDISPASEHDISFLKDNHLIIKAKKLYGDKAYVSSDLAEKMRLTGVDIITPVKKPKGGELTFAQHLHSSFVSSTRQIVETAFSWLQAKTGLAVASKIRSSKGLRRQVFGCLLAAAISCV